MTAVTVPDALESVGRFEHGQIVLDTPPVLPEGARLHVRFTVEAKETDYGWPKGFFESTAGQADPDFWDPLPGEFSCGVETVPFDNAAAEAYADIRADLERRGKAISRNDILIAAGAVSRDATLVTKNEKEFQRIPALKCLPLKDLAASGNTPSA